MKMHTLAIQVTHILNVYRCCDGGGGGENAIGLSSVDYCFALCRFCIRVLAWIEIHST